MATPKIANLRQKHSEGTSTENTPAILGRKHAKTSQDGNTKNSQPTPEALRRHICKKRPCHPRKKSHKNILGWQHQHQNQHTPITNINPNINPNTKHCNT